MLAVGTFVAGFASGWIARSTVDSSRDAVVKVVASYFGVVERLRRVVAMEREHIEDLVAEGRTTFEAKVARRVARSVSPSPVRAPEHGRAA